MTLGVLITSLNTFLIAQAPTRPPGAIVGDNVLVGRDVNSSSAFSRLFTQAFNLAIMAGAFIVFFQFIAGGLDWINSQGDKEKLVKAQKRITNAIIGFIILMSVWTLFFTVTSDLFGIFPRDASGKVQISFPSLF